MNDVIIKASSLSCQSGHRYILKDINWEVKKGEHWAVLGMNGSGKTTLLSIIAGFKQFTHGDLKVFGEQYNKDNILSFRKRIGWVSSSFFDRYFSKESALNIVLSGKCGTLIPDDSITNQDIILAKSLLTELQQGSRINYPFNLMSKGERQSVLIARALLSNPDILILDEPAAGLDIVARAYMLDTINKIAGHKKVTIIYVTHLVEEISHVFQNCILLRNGRIYDKGAIASLLTSETMSAFLQYPVNLHQGDKTGPPRLAIDINSKLDQLLVN